MGTENTTDEIDIDLQGLLYAILNKLTVIVLIGILAGGIAFTYTQYFIEPKYEATTQVYILSKKPVDDEKLSTSDLTFATYLANDYQVLLTCDPVMEEVINALGLDKTVEELQKMISVSLIEDTRVMEITVTSIDPEQAKKIADKVRDVANDKIRDVMEGIEAVNAVDEAKLPTTPASPNVEKNTMLGFVAGFGIALIVVIILFIMDDTIKTTEDIENYLGVSVLASIPLKTEKSKSNKKQKKKKRK